ncbi:MAG: transcriptional regulator, partial [Alphaproteobacteria bacterium]|nr:transcriptional regulator [Alphaproteobacteria bacterium]
DCVDETACAVRSVMQDVRDAIAQTLDNTSLAQMAARAGPAEPVLMYDI